MPASEAKGLEFDSVVAVEPAKIVDLESSRLNGLRRLYVVLTRAVSRLVVVHDEPLPPELQAAELGPAAMRSASGVGTQPDDDRVLDHGAGVIGTELGLGQRPGSRTPADRTCARGGHGRPRHPSRRDPRCLRASRAPAPAARTSRGARPAGASRLGADGSWSPTDSPADMADASALVAVWASQAGS